MRYGVSIIYITLKLPSQVNYRKYTIASKLLQFDQCKNRVCQTLQELYLLLKPARNTMKLANRKQKWDLLATSVIRQTNILNTEEVSTARFSHWLDLFPTLFFKF